ncbi:hypothetical protein [Bradyrhizobium sp. RDI18]|uniref:hypothetical protein n=1 Tax=Bradyrhizobium sp. RDI18 TaxID=3367400 RepID=UPI003716339B
MIYPVSGCSASCQSAIGKSESLKAFSEISCNSPFWETLQDNYVARNTQGAYLYGMLQHLSGASRRQSPRERRSADRTRGNVKTIIKQRVSFVIKKPIRYSRNPDLTALDVDNANRIPMAST